MQDEINEKTIALYIKTGTGYQPHKKRRLL